MGFGWAAGWGWRGFCAVSRGAHVGMILCRTRPLGRGMRRGAMRGGGREGAEWDF